jgi:hypothetical protein
MSVVTNPMTHDFFIGLALCSVVFLSAGFLIVAFYMNREMTKNERNTHGND